MPAPFPAPRPPPAMAPPAAPTPAPTAPPIAASLITSIALSPVDRACRLHASTSAVVGVAATLAAPAFGPPAFWVTPAPVGAAAVGFGTSALYQFATTRPVVRAVPAIRIRASVVIFQGLTVFSGMAC